MIISPLASGILVPSFKHDFPRHRSTISPLVVLISNKKAWCFAWCMNTEVIVKVKVNRRGPNIH
jgi:hypothetical protein